MIAFYAYPGPNGRKAATMLEEVAPPGMPKHASTEGRMLLASNPAATP